MRFEFAGNPYFIDFEYDRDIRLELSANRNGVDKNKIKDDKRPNTTICKISVGTYENVILKGFSHRSANDSFVKEMGRKISLTRALKIDLDNTNKRKEIAWNKYFRKAAWNAYFSRKQY